VTFWRTKAAISRKRVKREEKLLWTAYRNSPTLFRTVPSRPPRPPLVWALGIAMDRPNFWVSPINSGSGKATDFKSCTHIHRVNQNKSI